MDYESMTIKELREIAKEKGIEKTGSMRKAELVSVLTKAETATKPAKAPARKKEGSVAGESRDKHYAENREKRQQEHRGKTNPRHRESGQRISRRSPRDIMRIGRRRLTDILIVSRRRLLMSATKTMIPG